LSAVRFPERVSGGASCGLMGLVGAVVYLNVYRRDELSYLQRPPMLLLFGLLTERTLGAARFAVLLGLTSLAGGLLSAVLFPERVSVGASCGLMGLVGAVVYLNVYRRDELSYLQRPPMLLVLLYPVMSAVSGLGATTNLTAHVGGMAAGFLLCGVLTRGKPLARLADGAQRWVTAAGLCMAAAFGAAAVVIAWRALGLL
jgi:membrane associated rhomboid family serine protease